MLGPTDKQIVGKWWNMTPKKPKERFTVGKQPCQAFLRGDADIAALGEGNRRNLHQCPTCSGNRAWCDTCNRDHHDGGWETCKPGAYDYVESDLIDRLRDNALIKESEAWRRLDGGQDLSIGASLANEAADRIETLQTTLRNVRGYIKDCDHEPAVDEIDAALGS